ncbi:MAG: lysophospholipid acyltransferase family protein [Planctomycetota bacterium]
MSRTRKEKRRRAARRRRRDRVLYVLARLGLGAFRHLPLRTASRLGEAAGRLAFLLMRERRRRALRHVHLAFGDRLPATKRREIAAASFRVLFACAAEWLVMSGLGRERAMESVVRVDGWEHVTEALEGGRGAVFATAHFGLFELLPVCFVHRGVSGKVVGRRPGDVGLEALVAENRKRMGMESVPQQRAREILRVLKGGGVVGTLPDQDVDKLPGVFVPFFGRPAYTPSGPASLAVAAGAPLVSALAYRIGPGRHRVVVHPPVPDPGGEKEERIRALTAAFTRVFEEKIAATPDHWAWVHERWATTPERLARRRARRAGKAARATRRRLIEKPV